MPTLRPLILLAVLSGYAADASPAAAQIPPSPQSAPPHTAVSHSMVFFDAHGGPNACGPGCSEWIAADGEIDFGSANRLQRLLLQLNGAQPPVFFHSAGGKLVTAMELGRLIRARQMTVSIGHTVPRDCDLDSTGENSCESKINAGQPIAAELDPLTPMCNSACGFAMAGGTVRLIPPGVTLGIHDIDADPTHRFGTRALKFEDASIRARLHNYMHLMGIDDRFLSEAFEIPNAAMGRLTRDDAVRFGLDRREFGETVWGFSDKPAPVIRQWFFTHAGGEQPHYVDGLVDLSCATRPAVQYVLAFGRRLLASDPSAASAQPPVGARLGDRQFSFAREQHPKLYLRSTKLELTALDGVADAATIVLPGAEFGRDEGPAGDITLTMVGFSTAYAKLRQACALGELATPAAPPAQGLIATRPPEPNPPGAGLPVGKEPNPAR